MNDPVPKPDPSDSSPPPLPEQPAAPDQNPQPKSAPPLSKSIPEWKGIATTTTKIPESTATDNCATSNAPVSHPPQHKKLKASHEAASTPAAVTAEATGPNNNNTARSVTATSTAAAAVPPSTALHPPTVASIAGPIQTGVTNPAALPAKLNNPLGTTTTVPSSTTGATAVLPATQSPATTTSQLLLPDYAAVRQTVFDMLALLQMYGPLTANQLEYNLPPVGAAATAAGKTVSNTNTNTNAPSWTVHDVLMILVALGLIQQVVGTAQYCVQEGVPRADALLPADLPAAIRQAEHEANASWKRSQILRAALKRIDPTQQQQQQQQQQDELQQQPQDHQPQTKALTVKAVLKQILAEYPEIVQDPVYWTAFRNCHVEISSSLSMASEKQQSRTTSTAGKVARSRSNSRNETTKKTSSKAKIAADTQTTNDKTTLILGSAATDQNPIFKSGTTMSAPPVTATPPPILAPVATAKAQNAEEDRHSAVASPTFTNHETAQKQSTAASVQTGATTVQTGATTVQTGTTTAQTGTAPSMSTMPGPSSSAS